MHYLLLIVFSFTLAACQNFGERDQAVTTPAILKNTPSVSSKNIHNKQQAGNVNMEDHSDISETSPDEQPLPVLPANLWSRFQTGLQLDYTGQPNVQTSIDWYIKNRRILEDSQQRIRYYLFFIMDELEKQGIPFDVALIPLIESQYNPFASSGQPAGLWQFMPGTGRRFNLYTNSWYDGRKDPIESTKAVATYFRYLMNLFNNDFMLSLAAYNSGEGTVQNAINKNRRLGKPTDFWSLDLPAITRTYIPKMIALAEIFKHPEKYQLALIDIPNQPYFTEIKIQGAITLKQASGALNMQGDELFYLNAGINRNAHPYRPQYSINIPINKKDTAPDLLAKVPKEVFVEQQTHLIKNGENLGSIAKKYHISTRQLREWNYLKTDTINVGKTLVIATPAHGNTAVAASSTHSKTQSRAPQKTTKGNSSKNTIIHHRIKAGESLWKIAQIYKVKPSDLAAWNKKSANQPLKTGDNLVIYKTNK